MSRFFGTVAVVVLATALGTAQTKDVQGCKDSPLVGRFPGSVITACTDKADDVFAFQVASGPQKTLEGEFHQLNYDFPKTASKAEVVRNLNAALKTAGYVFDNDSGPGGDFTVHKGKTWMQIEVSGGGNYKETIVVEIPLTQLVVADPTATGLTGAGGGPAAAPHKDAPGCKDSSLIGRFPGSAISACVDKPDDAFAFQMGNAPQKKMEGEFHQVNYDFPSTASKAQVVRNLNTALRTAGYTFDYDSGAYGDFTVHKGKTWIQIEVSGGGSYRETFIFETQLTQDVVANAKDLASGLTSNGHTVVTGIHFDTGKAEVKADSATALQEVVKLLKADSALKLFVVGHTDTVGDLAGNLDLSKRRALAVVQILTTQYAIGADRLQAYGNGPYAPLASNDTEDGRALNRRVELVKQ